LALNNWFDISLFLYLGKEMLKSSIYMAGFEDLSFDSPFKFHKYSINCLKNKVIYMTRLMVFIVN